MKRVKVFLVTLNNFPTSAWERKLELTKNDIIYHWKNMRDCVNNLHHSPDVIVIDHYFSRDKDVMELLDDLHVKRKQGTAIKTFCFSPTFCQLEDGIFQMGEVNDLILSNLNKDSLGQLNDYIVGLKGGTTKSLEVILKAA